MKRFYFITLLIFALFLTGCKNVTTPQQENPTVQQKSYPKLKVENKRSTGDFIFLVELPNYTISPLEIRSGESMTFELTEGLWCYENVTVLVQYGSNRSAQNRLYVRKNFADGQTTVVTLQ